MASLSAQAEIEDLTSKNLAQKKRIKLQTWVKKNKGGLMSSWKKRWFVLWDGPERQFSYYLDESKEDLKGGGSFEGAESVIIDGLHMNVATPKRIWYLQFLNEADLVTWKEAIQPSKQKKQSDRLKVLLKEKVQEAERKKDELQRMRHEVNALRGVQKNYSFSLESKSIENLQLQQEFEELKSRYNELQERKSALDKKHTKLTDYLTGRLGEAESKMLYLEHTNCQLVIERDELINYKNVTEDAFRQLRQDNRVRESTIVMKDTVIATLQSQLDAVQLRTTTLLDEKDTIVAQQSEDYARLENAFEQLKTVNSSSRKTYEEQIGQLEEEKRYVESVLSEKEAEVLPETNATEDEWINWFLSNVESNELTDELQTRLQESNDARRIVLLLGKMVQGKTQEIHDKEMGAYKNRTQTLMNDLKPILAELGLRGGNLESEAGVERLTNILSILKDQVIQYRGRQRELEGEVKLLTNKLNFATNQNKIIMEEDDD